MVLIPPIQLDFDRIRDQVSVMLFGDSDGNIANLASDSKDVNAGQLMSASEAF